MSDHTKSDVGESDEPCLSAAADFVDVHCWPHKPRGELGRALGSCNAVGMRTLHKQRC